ncbi:MAG: MarR family transcriptional regulator [Bacteroidales bacterium]|nr:MarR family transcriptional regulator [Bacteroidales bacterium]
MTDHTDLLKLSNQICFLVYRIDREFNAHYRPFLKTLGLTYPQYLVMLVLWEEDGIPIGSICTRLKLDTGTISPLLRRLEKLGHIRRQHSTIDERSYLIHLTPQGRELKARATSVPHCLLDSMCMTFDDYLSARHDLERLLQRVERTKLSPTDTAMPPGLDHEAL